MKTIKHHFLLLIALVLFNIQGAHSQQTEIRLQNKNIQHFIQVWGLVKYKSQKSIAGKFDADQVFLSLIDSVKNADNSKFNQLMLQLIGPVDPSFAAANYGYTHSQLNKNQHLLKNVDYEWIKDQKYNKELRDQLLALSHQVNLSEKHHYVPTVWYAGDLPNEAPYSDYSFDQEKMNLLTLAKAWNAIEYLFPYKYVMDQDWREVLVEMVPAFRKITDRISYEKSVLRLAVAINDTHAITLIRNGNLKLTNVIFNVRYYPPFDYVAERKGIIVRKFLNDSLAKSSALRAGDQIVTINGIKIEKWLKERAALIPASNEAVKYRELSTSGNDRGDTFAFSNLESGNLKVKVRRGNAYLNLNLLMLDRQDKKSVELIQNSIIENRKKEQQIKGLENLSDDITVIRAGYFFDKNLPATKDIAQLSAELKSKKVLIFDMRRYPQSPGFFTYFLPLMLGKAPFAFARYYAVDLKDIGTFKHREGIENYMNYSPDAPKPMGELYKGKIVILTDANTQSMGEWFTMMLSQFNSNTTIIGSQTAGADGDLKKLTLPGGYKFSFTGNGIFYPNGKETQRIGIVPDVIYKPTIKELIGDEDAQLNRAIRYINAPQTYKVPTSK